MRQETRRIMTAFANGLPRKAARTETDGQRVWLHNNLIAERRDDGSVWATLAGWPTVTTRERLNGLCETLGKPRAFSQRYDVQHHGDREIESTEWVQIA